jgi:hypothetical protein
MPDQPQPQPQSGQPEGGDRPREILARLYALCSLIYIVWMLWAVMVPDHQKTAMRLRLLRSCELVTRRLARLTGAASVSHEARTGQQSYALPYGLSVAGDLFRELYDRARDVSA